MSKAARGEEPRREPGRDGGEIKWNIRVGIIQISSGLARAAEYCAGRDRDDL